MKLRSVLSFSAACIALSAPLHAATVTLNISGTTDGSDGTISYTPGSTFTATAVFDDAFADTNVDANTGFFFDFGAATTALVSFELTTELGSISYDPSAVSAPLGTFLAPQVSQSSPSNLQRFNLVSGGDPLGEAYSGAIGSLAPNFLGLTIAAQGPDNNLFDDPNSLFSGFEDGFATDPIVFGGQINVAQFGSIADFDETTLFFGAAEFSITSGAGVPPTDGPTDPVSPVPLPAGLPLLIAGLGAFGMLARRKEALA